MPAENIRRPAYFGCSTGPPRSTAISEPGSRIARSIAVSKGANVVSSSALSALGLRNSTIEAFPARLMDAAPRSTDPSLAQQVERFGTGQKHRVAQVAAGLRMGKNMREENTVVYFKA